MVPIHLRADIAEMTFVDRSATLVVTMFSSVHFHKNVNRPPYGLLP